MRLAPRVETGLGILTALSLGRVIPPTGSDPAVIVELKAAGLVVEQEGELRLAADPSAVTLGQVMECLGGPGGGCCLFFDIACADLPDCPVRARGCPVLSALPDATRGISLRAIVAGDVSGILWTPWPAAPYFSIPISFGPEKSLPA